MEESRNQTHSNFDNLDSEFNKEELLKLLGRYNDVLEEKKTKDYDNYKIKEDKKDLTSNRPSDKNVESFSRRLGKSTELTDDRKRGMILNLQKLLLGMQSSMNVSIIIDNAGRIDKLPFRDFIEFYDKSIKDMAKDEDINTEICRRINNNAPNIMKFAYLGNYVFTHYGILLSGVNISKIASSSSELYKLVFDITNSIGSSAVSLGTVETLMYTILDNFERDNSKFFNDEMYLILRLFTIFLHLNDGVSSKIFSTFILTQLDIIRLSK